MIHFFKEFKAHLKLWSLINHGLIYLFFKWSTVICFWRIIFLFFKVIQKFNTFWWWFCFTLLLPHLSHLCTHQLLFISLSLQNKQASTKKNKSKRSEKAEQRKPTTRNHITQEKYQWNKITFTKQNMTKKIYKNTLGSILCWPSTLGLRPPRMYDINN